VGWIPDNVVNAMRSSHLLGIFMRLATSPALHLWFGVHDIPAGFDSIDADGTVYLGGGRLIGVPTLEVLVNGKADAVEFTLSGIAPGVAQKMIDDIPPVRGCEMYLGITTLDDHYQPMSAIIPIWHGVASHISESSPPVSANENPTLSLSLVVTAGEPTRSRPSRALWSSAHQKSTWPNDRFCDATARLSRGVEPVWPDFS
jgi:hypothetical protein